MSVAARALEGASVCICAGAGGVGKTTVSAALALGLAARGARVAVVTIDPAQRLADALGLDTLDNEPRQLATDGFAAHGVRVGGELWAMTLDPKRTFDDLVAHLAHDAGQRDAILTNRIYRRLSASVAGSQEWTAVAKLDELQRSGRFDVLVLDTPPSRNALDFLEAPERLSAFLQDRAVRTIAAPGGVTARGTAAGLRLMRRVTGVDLLGDLGTLFGALGGTLDGFARRTERVARLLHDPATAFVLATSPTPAAIDEAAFLAQRLEASGGALRAVVVNRVHLPVGPPAATDPAAVAAALGIRDGALAAKAAAALADVQALAARDAEAVARVGRDLAAGAPLIVPELEAGAHDTAGIAAVCRALFTPTRRRNAAPAAA